MRHTLSEINEVTRMGICSVCGIVKLHSRDPKSPKLKGKWACSIKQVQKKRFRRSGLTPEQYILTQIRVQCCEICSKTIEDNKRGLAVDHCHTTGKFRGMLCHKCNIGIGMFEDNIEIIKNAIKYLRQRKKGD